MYDTVNFRLLLANVSDDVLIGHLERPSEHIYSDGSVVVRGDIGNLKVSLSGNCVKVGQGSLCKYQLGDNFKTMTLRDTREAIEHLSDVLHLQMAGADVTRMDVGASLMVKQPPCVYLSHLGLLRGRGPLKQPYSYYYYTTDGQLCFYDKRKEQREKHRPIPDLYQRENVLRYEQRYLKRLPKHFKTERVTAAMLYDEYFYKDVVNRWRDAYTSIEKIDNVTIDFSNMQTKKQLLDLSVVAYVEQMGGLLKFIDKISLARKQGKLTRKQAYDLKDAAREAYQVGGTLMTQDGAIEELDKRVAEAVRYYR